MPSLSKAQRLNQKCKRRTIKAPVRIVEVIAWQIRRAATPIVMAGHVGANSRRWKRKGLSVQEASQRFRSVVLGLLSHAGIRRTIEVVIRPRIYVELDRHSGPAQSIRIG